MSTRGVHAENAVANRVRRKKVNNKMDNSGCKENDLMISRKIKEELLESIEKISFGEVVVTIHDSKIVQVEKKEKKRFS